ncbi:MAG: ParB/RepB/Spo0J family partition protein [Proteobacteria bacterium]|nr:ParB/RepB/Spo0J family partition protein [Pseudomonadota bacterium]
MSNPPKRRLGRGLSALLPATGSAAPPDARAVDGATGGQDAASGNAQPARRIYFEAPIEDVYPNPDQPRKRFEEAELDELAQSIRAHGVIQPLIVRTRAEGGYYLIAGERRWRAAQRAGFHDVPVVVQEVAPKEAFERALVENLQRSDLNAIEEAEAFRRLVDEFGYTQEKVAERVGKERSTITNSLRLLRLPKTVRRMVEDGELNMGHARALLGLDSEAEIETMARNVEKRSLSVRATEDMVRKRTQKSAPKSQQVQKSASVRDLEERLTKSLGAKVQITEDKRGSGNGGRVEIRYFDLDDLDRLLDRLLD